MWVKHKVVAQKWRFERTLKDCGEEGVTLGDAPHAGEQ